MSLRFNRVTYRYPDSGQGVSDIDLEVKRGELVAVIGPSGSGKSTLLKLVSGLITDHAGSIALNGADLQGTPIHKRNLGMVFQSYALFPHLNVIDNVAYGLKLRGVSVAARAKKARDLLALVGLADFATRAVTQLSGGQQQRVALARALAIDPAALLLDEPLAALDPEIRERLRDEIRVLQRRFGATTLLVTHDQQEALVMSDRVAVLKDGRLVQIATPRELYERPANSAVAAFVGQSTLFDARVVDRDTVDVGFAQLKADAGARAPGAKVKVLIRPERVDANPSSNAINQLRGKTGLERFIGATVRFDFLIDGASQPLLVESAQVARQAVAIAPVNVILLDD